MANDNPIRCIAPLDLGLRRGILGDSRRTMNLNHQELLC
jgi:hypothetical protein